jgi:hypothetical protein
MERGQWQRENNGVDIMPLFYAPVTTPMIIASEGAADAGGVTSTITINVPFLYAFEVSGQSLLVHQVRWRMGATTTGHTNMAIYTAAGNLVAGSDTGAVLNVANTTHTPAYGTDVLLGPGQYWLALASDNGTDTYGGISGILARIGATRHRQGTNLLAAGAMPATLGAITTSTNNPFMALLPTGSLIT